MNIVSSEDKCFFHSSLVFYIYLVILAYSHLLPIFACVYIFFNGIVVLYSLVRIVTFLECSYMPCNLFLVQTYSRTSLVLII